MNDAPTIQSQLDRLMTDTQMLQQALQQKVADHEQLAKQIEQHKGALAYNEMLIQSARKQLSDLAASAAASGTDARQPSL